jgi:hypothetical protein
MVSAIEYIFDTTWEILLKVMWAESQLAEQIYK